LGTNALLKKRLEKRSLLSNRFVTSRLDQGILLGAKDRVAALDPLAIDLEPVAHVENGQSSASKPARVRRRARK
jgi:hypothetical protein